MQVTKFTLRLWIGSSTFASFTSYVLGAVDVLRTASPYLTDGELQGGKAFTLAMPIVAASTFAGIGAILAIISLFSSWRYDRQPFLSVPHGIALVFVMPLLAIGFLSLQ